MSRDFLPVIVLTADTTRDALTRALEVGANDFLTKPVDADEVVLRVRNLVSIRLCHEELKQRNSSLAAQLRSALFGRRLQDEDIAVGRARIRELLDAGEPHIVYQPVVELGNGHVLGHEALARFPMDGRTPDLVFDDAGRVGLGTELELVALQRALQRMPELPAGQVMALNVSPPALIDERTLELLETQDLARVAVEITEHHPIDDYEALAGPLGRLRAGGAKIVVDDAGAGYASFQHILRLAPDVIKLDISLTRDIDADAVRRALAASLVQFARDVDARLVAEGIETAEELRTLQDLGVGYGQGFHLAPPSTVLLEHADGVSPV
jgi:EAL domain-containing protein (putative c-di-GMP-specific phosphodiesterase class I)